MSSYVFISLKKSGHWITWKLYVLLQSHWDGMFLQFSSVAQSCLTLCDAMNHSMPGLPVHHQLPEFTQTHAHWVGDAIQPSHPLSSPPPPSPNPSQHQGLFQWVNSSHEVAKVCSLGYHNWELVHLDFFLIQKSFSCHINFCTIKLKMYGITCLGY